MSNAIKTLYTAEHEWLKYNDETNEGVLGITDHAQNELGEVVFVQLPEVGDTVSAGDVVGEVESTKSVSDIYAPVSGEVVAINEELADNAGLVNEDPYNNGWLYEVKVTEAGELMDSGEYAAANE